MKLRNNYFNKIFPETIISFGKGKELVWADFELMIEDNVAYITSFESSHWILYHSEPTVFLARFLALVSLGKTSIIPPNIQPETLNLIHGQFDTGVQLFPEEIARQNNTYSSKELTLDFNSKAILFTSGSSGEPKAIKKSLDNLLAEVEQIENIWGNDIRNIVATVSHQHLYGFLFRLLWPFFTGKAFIDYQLKYPEELTNFKINTSLVTSPAILSRLDATVDYHQFNKVFSSGGPLALEDSNKAQELLAQRPIEVYGSTETGGIGYRQQQINETPWKLMPSVDIFQTLETFKIKSAFIYQEELELDDDLELLGDGLFLLKGRKDRTIKLEEKRVSLTQMELFLEKSALVESAKCLVLQHKRELLGAVIVLSDKGKKLLSVEGKKSLVKQLKQELLELFELVVLPKKWRFIDTMPTNSMNKVKMAKLEELFV